MAYHSSLVAYYAALLGHLFSQVLACLGCDTAFCGSLGSNSAPCCSWWLFCKSLDSKCAQVGQCFREGLFQYNLKDLTIQAGLVGGCRWHVNSCSWTSWTFGRICFIICMSHFTWRFAATWASSRNHMQRSVNLDFVWFCSDLPLAWVFMSFSCLASTLDGSHGCTSEYTYKGRYDTSISCQLSLLTPWIALVSSYFYHIHNV